MEKLGTYILSVTAAALLLSILQSIAGKNGTHAALLKLIGGLFLTFTTIAVVFAIVSGINGFGDFYNEGFEYSLFFGLLAGIFFFGTMVFTSLWVMGLYIGRTYMEAKHRPRYVIADVLYKK